MDAARLEQVLDPDFLGDITTQSLDEIRSKRGICQELEVSSSYLRRVAQGRLDIVAAERRRRADSGEALDHDHLVEQLSEILAGPARAEGNGILPQLLAPGGDDITTDDLDAILGPGAEASLSSLPDEELDRLVASLSEYESGISGVRHELHHRIDALQAEITRRYKSGEASVDALLAERPS